MEYDQTLGDQIAAEIARVTELLTTYQGTGPAGETAVQLLTKTLARATNAQASGDVVTIYNAYQELKWCQ